MIFRLSGGMNTTDSVRALMRRLVMIITLEKQVGVAGPNQKLLLDT